jgi:hypothetical protein
MPEHLQVILQPRKEPEPAAARAADHIYVEIGKNPPDSSVWRCFSSDIFKILNYLLMVNHYDSLLIIFIWQWFGFLLLPTENDYTANPNHL